MSLLAKCYGHLADTVRRLVESTSVTVQTQLSVRFALSGDKSDGSLLTDKTGGGLPFLVRNGRNTSGSLWNFLGAFGKLLTL